MTEYKPLKGTNDSRASLLEKAADRFDLANIGKLSPTIDKKTLPESPKAALPKAALPEAASGEIPSPKSMEPVRTPQMDSRPIIDEGVIDEGVSEDNIALPSQQLLRGEAMQAAPVPSPKPASMPNTAPPMEKNLAAVKSSRPVQEIDRDALKAANFIVPDGPVTGLSEEFRIVKRQLLSHVSSSRSGAFDKMASRILICSAQSGEGKTFCAINLALSIAAEQDYNVLLIDADFAKPGASTIFGLNKQAGLMDALSNDELALGDLIVPTDIPGFSILPAGNRTNRDTEFLASTRTGDVLDRLAEEDSRRIMIFDSPPALAASPASELASHVGQAVMIVRADKTSETSLRDALSLVARCEKIQLMLNGVKFSATGRSFGSYYGYGEE
jgi:exopolysaccharide/PEP-CTERM locus tyrosine autokinase